MGNRSFLLKFLAPTIFFVFYLYLAHQILRHSGFSKIEILAGATWLLIVFSFVIVPPLFFWSRQNRGESKTEIEIQQVSHYAQGYFSYILFLVVIRDILAFVMYMLNVSIIIYDGREALFILFAPCLLMLLGRVVVALGPFNKKIKIKFPNLQEDLKGIRITQISDLHIGPGVTLKKVKYIIKKANALGADIIVLTGDIVDHLDKWFEKEINELGNLKAKYGIYYIPGNHEYYWGFWPIISKIKKLGITVLLNENKKINIKNTTLAICGITDPAAKYFSMEEPDLKKAKDGAEGSAFHLLLSHHPSLADEAQDYGYDLQLSGHTHAGQFIPWSLIIRLFQKYSKGLYELKKMKLYVNRGTGFWGPPDRLGTYSEITEITLG